MGIFQRFWSGQDGRKGNVAILFALALIPVVGATGAAVDYALANASRTSMQKALDSTALALAKLMPLSQAQLDTQGWQIFQASLGHVTVQLSQGNLQISTPSSGKLVLNVTGQYQPSISGIIGINSFPVGARAEVTWGLGKVEVALVLDSSLSMNQQGRIQALRTATVDLLNVLEAAARNPGDAKVGIVAFDGMVNTGYTYNNRPSWVRFDWWAENVGSCDKSANNKTDCQAISYCSKSQYTTKTSCQNNNGTWKQAVWTQKSESNWKGCVYDRNQPHDVSDTAPTNTNTYYPAAECYSSTPPQAITALTENWNSLRSKANALTPTGYTNITIGLAWGFHLLSPTAPYTEGKAYNTKDLSKYIILMTDGDNTKNIWNNGSSCNTPCVNSINARTLAACTNIKAAGIKIYSIRLVDGNASLLRDCASDPTMYYDVQNANQLSGVFSAIGGQLANLHLSQ